MTATNMSGRLLLTTSLVALISGGVASTPVAAQDTQGAAALEEIVVTARKRSETLQDVPFSIAAMTGDDLREAGAANLEDVALNVAGFTVQNLGPGQSQVAMRGISSGQIVRDQPGVKEQVGIYLDESVISLSLFTPDLDLYDLDRVEVLRGPQGTLFGSGSISGTVRYITRKPQLNINEGSGEVNGGFIGNGGFEGSVKGMVNFPLGDTMALRAVGYYNTYGGFIDAVQPDLSVNKDVNDGDRFGTRIALTFQPNERLSITPRFIYQDVNVDGFNRVDIYNILANPYTTTRPAVTLGKRQQFTQLQEAFEDEFMLIDATIQYDFSNLSLTSVSSYTDRDVLVVRDSTQLSGSVIYQFIDQTEGVFNLDAPLIDATSAEVFTQEVRLASDSDGPVQWVAGAFYSDIERVYSQNLPVTGFTAATGIPTAGFLANTDELFKSYIPYDFEQFALFGEATYDVNDRLHVTAGLRWFDFSEKRVLNFDGIFSDPTNAQPGKTSTNGVSPRVMVSYDANDDIVVNAQASKGFRLGGINDPLNAGACTPADLATFGGRPNFGNETLWNYEAGIKAKIMDGRGTFNAAIFYADVSGMQFTVDAGTCSSRIVYNADARSMGAEAELFIRANENFDFSLKGSVVDPEIRESVTAASLEKGNQLPTVPKLQLSAAASYRQPVMGMDGYITIVGQHVGSRFTQAADAVNPNRTVDLTVIPVGAPSVASFAYSTKLPSYQIVNLRIGVENERWSLAAFVTNLTDERARLALDRERGTLARVGFLTNQPRTFGLSAQARF